MSNLRFILAAVALFAGTFAAVSWTSKSFHVKSAREAPAVAEAPASAVAAVPHPEIVQAVEEADTPAGDPDVGRNQMRLTAIHAADAYARSPCDMTIRTTFVVAASTYMRAAGAGEQDVPHFATALDTRVRAAIATAFDVGGINPSDFPVGTPLWTPARLSGGAPPTCAGARQAERRDR